MDYAAVILWMASMFGLSTDQFSSAHTAPFTTVLLLKMLPALSALGVDMLDLLVRKLAHMSEYCILGILLANVFNNRSSLTRKRQIVCAIVLGIVYAAGDELHQSFVPSRTPSPFDVLIDTIGLVSGIVAFYGYCAIRQARTTSENTHMSPRALSKVKQ
jgi:VanZ family protein